MHQSIMTLSRLKCSSITRVSSWILTLPWSQITHGCQMAWQNIGGTPAVAGTGNGWHLMPCHCKKYTKINGKETESVNEFNERATNKTNQQSTSINGQLIYDVQAGPNLCVHPPSPDGIYALSSLATESLSEFVHPTWNGNGAPFPNIHINIFGCGCCCPGSVIFSFPLQPAWVISYFSKTCWKFQDTNTVTRRSTHADQALITNGRERSGPVGGFGAIWDSISCT